MKDPVEWGLMLREYNMVHRVGRVWGGCEEGVGRV